MKVLVINTGSSSLKFSLFEAEREQVLAEGAVDWSTMPARFTLRCPGQPERRSQLLVGSHGDAVGRVLDELTRGEPAVLRSLDEIAAVGHRVVHGGDVHTASVQVTPAVKKSLAGLAELAPLHNPANLEGIHAAEAALPGVPQVAVFDTAFHATIPEAARVYPLPYAWYRDWGLRRYGFHGLSHAYCAARAAQMLGRTPSPPTPLPQGGGEGSILFPLPQGGGETNAVSPPSESPRRSISSPLPQGGGEGSILSPLPQGGG
ncbi:MAG TPA: hypothetical protein VNK04_16360, partial [Gemmataceae bacterium]|nr:hypothetical protein [Gemmataceae bacterium]